MHPGIRQLIARATAGKWRLGTPCTRGQILRAETQLRISFPEDYRDYLEAGGLAMKNTAPRGLWRLDELVSLNRTMPVFQWFRGIVGIGNEGFMVYGFDFRDSNPVVVSFGLSASDWADVTEEARSFEAWLSASL